MLNPDEPTLSTPKVTDAYRGESTSIISRLFECVDASSILFFRVAFGGLLAAWAWDYLESGRVKSFYMEPTFHFTYTGLDWVQPWPGNGMLVHFAGLFVLAIFIAIGFCYRAASLLFALGFTYFFLLDRTNYQNHYYLIGLLAWWLPWMPLNRSVSVDAWIWSNIKDPTVPAWSLWILRFHIALPYFFGGIAKLNSDWLQGEPITQMLAAKGSLPIVGGLLATESTAIAFAWIAMLFDLFIVPMLLLKRTQLFAYGMCIVFHIMNAVVFNIHIFPWLMLAATPIFFPPDWPRRVLGGAPIALQRFDTSIGGLSVKRKLVIAIIGCYVLFHCAWPLRHLAYPGDASWNEQGHYFAWRMMLRGKSVVLGYAIKDQLNGNVVDGRINRFINGEQSDKFSRDPEMILQLAHFLGEDYRKSTGNAASVYALVLASLNGRKPELMIDPNVDLMRESRGFGKRNWVMQQKEPLRRPAWNQPPEKWREHVELPELKFLAKSTASKSTPAPSAAKLAELD